MSYLLTKGQAADGSYSSRTGAGVTAICTTAILRSGRSANDPAVSKSLAYLEKLVQKDGGIYADGSTHKNYETCLAMVCFKEANQNGRYDRIVKNAEKYVKDQQWDEGEGNDKSSVNYGGAATAASPGLICRTPLFSSTRSSRSATDRTIRRFRKR